MTKLFLLPFKVMLYPIIFILGFGSALVSAFDKHDRSRRR